MRIGIVGAGVAGLSSAIRMALRGYQVDIYEANSYPGGKLSSLHLNNYKFDAGPSVFTMPQYFEELFSMAGKSFQDYCPYIKLDILTKYFYEDNTIVNGFADNDKFAIELNEKLGVANNLTLQHLAKSASIYNDTEEIFLNKSVHTLKQHSAFNLIASTRKLAKINLFSSMHSVNHKRFKNAKAEQIFDRYATYNGSNPYSAPATLNVIPHLEHNIGGFFPLNGMRSLTESLHQLGNELGVHYHFSTKVDEIIVQDKKAVGLSINGKEEYFDKVISASDVHFTYRKLLKHQSAPEQTLRQEKSSSAIVFYWGINHQFKELCLHNILFSKDYKAEFDSIFSKGLPYNDPTVYINITSKHKPTDAPQGGENWFVMINTPHINGQNWEQLIKEARKNIIKKINRVLNINIETFIEEEDFLDPRRIESRTLSYLGALYGNSSNHKMAPFLRHPNFSKKIKNLYFCGGSVHPGGGIPLCMLSAKIVDELMHL